jgi:hypothetical protein
MVAKAYELLMEGKLPDDLLQSFSNIKVSNEDCFVHLEVHSQKFFKLNILFHMAHDGLASCQVAWSSPKLAHDLAKLGELIPSWSNSGASLWASSCTGWPTS